jgi:hypothetical protein
VTAAATVRQHLQALGMRHLYSRAPTCLGLPASVLLWLLTAFCCELCSGCIQCGGPVNGKYHLNVAAMPAPSITALLLLCCTGCNECHDSSTGPGVSW